MRHEVVEVAQNPKTATVVSTAIGTTAAGLSTYFDLLPGVLGIIASLFGIVLTTVLIYKTLISAKIKELELEILKNAATDAARERRERGLPCRRNEDTA